MVSGFISRLVILIFGTLYPAYASYKAVRTKNVKEYVKWMMYWIVFAFFTCAETFTDLFLSFWFPFYYEIKIITVIYLLSPATKGSSILYRKFVHPVLTKREQEIDEYIAKAKEQGYHTMLNLGSKGVNYATSLIMQTAIKGLPNLPLTPSSDFLPAKTDVTAMFDIEDSISVKDLSEESMGQGGGGLVNQLRKSYSLSDLREEENGTVTDGGVPKRIRRNQAQITNLKPENYGDTYEHMDDGESIVSEDLSSRYSGGEPFYYEMRRPKGDVLLRTASLGPSSRVRTRAVTKNGLPVRASLSEGGSTWSAMETNESRNETNNFNLCLSHSSSYPLPLTSFQPYFFQDYEQMFRNSQMLAFLNNAQYSQFLNDKNVFSNVSLERETDENNTNSVILEEINTNLNNSTEIGPKREVQTSDSQNAVNLTSRKSEEVEKITEKKDTNIDKSREKESVSSNSENTDKEKSTQERSGRYNKKQAPVPPNEDSVSKSSSNLTVEEESEFYTPNPSPQPTRKQILSDSEDKNNLNDVQTKSETVSKTAPKKTKTKKWIPNKKSFFFWPQKGTKQSNSETSSIASVESNSTKSENQMEIFIPLKDDSEN